MSPLVSLAKHALPHMLLLAALTVVASAQSGRCMMEGFVVGTSVSPGLGGATVELIGDPDAPRLRDVKLSTRTDDDGRYSLKDIPYGDYTLRVSSPGYVPYQINIYMLPDATTQLHVRLRKKEAPAEERN